MYGKMLLHKLQTRWLLIIDLFALLSAIYQMGEIINKSVHS